MKEGGVWGRDDDLRREVRRGQDDGKEVWKENFGAFIMVITALEYPEQAQTFFSKSLFSCNIMTLFVVIFFSL